MLSMVKDFITTLSQKSVTAKLEEVLTYDEKKLVAVFSKKDYMASFEILTNYEYDFLVINANDESIVLNKTKKLESLQELLMEIEADYSAFVRQSLPEAG